MSYLTQWSFDPFVIVVGVVVVWHEMGLARLARRSRPLRSAERRGRSWYFYGGLALLLVAVVSPIDFWSDDYFFVHMTQHIVLMFFAPPLVVLGAPWLPMLHALPVDVRRRLLRAVLLGTWARPLRALGRAVTNGWVAVVAFNVVMVFWHVPGPFDLAESNQMVHIWLMHASFFVAGVFFWLQIFPSYPLRPKLTWVERGGALITTNVVMWGLAIALSFLTTHTWYSAYEHVPGVTLSPLTDQQIGAGVLFVCGDFWAVPAFIWVVRQAMAARGTANVLVDRLLQQGTASSSVDEVARA